MSSLFAAIEWPFGIAAGTAVGTGVGEVIRPNVQDISNAAWRNAVAAGRSRPPAYAVLAEGVAQGKIDPAWAADRAAEQGISGDAFSHLIAAAKTEPTMATALTLWRRGVISEGQFAGALRQAGMEDSWIPYLEQLKADKLSPQALAYAVVRGLVADHGILPVAPPVSGDTIPRFPVFPIDWRVELLNSGLDADQFGVLVGSAGRPMAPEAAALAYFKGIIGLDDYYLSVAEGDIRNEYRTAILENSRYRLRPPDYAGLWLRGWLTRDEAHAGAADFGVTTDPVVAGKTTLDLLYENRGRPATPRQVHLGYMRGATLPGAASEDEALQRAVQESDIRTEWAAIEKANRWSYPSPFVVRQLAQSGAITHDETLQLLAEMGWVPKWAQAAADAWARSAAPVTTQPWANRARTRVFTAAHKNFMDGTMSAAEMGTILGELGATAADRDEAVRVLTIERDSTQRDLTQAQILKLYKKAVWTRDQALSALEAMDSPPANANALLDAV